MVAQDFLRFRPRFVGLIQKGFGFDLELIEANIAGGGLGFPISF